MSEKPIITDGIFEVEDARGLSLGNPESSITSLTPHGPLLAGRRAPLRVERPEFYSWVLTTRQRIVVAVLTAGWAVAVATFWLWWLQPEHNVGWPGFMLNSVLLLYLLCLPSYFLVAANRMRQVDPSLEVPRLRVAFVVTKAPSEPWSLAQKTLRAMLGQSLGYPYDVWLCDEDPTEETVKWCQANDVRLSTRRGIAGYHRALWPRRTKCKEGNLAYFYDNYGYDNYDVVAQLDCDHVPAPTYLPEMVRPFNDSAVGYVAAPSMCDTNAPSSWSARGRVHKEGIFHGPLQLGHNRGLAPACIGSHYAVRTRAIRAIGGIGPELAEDFSTTFLLNSAGWHGAFAHNAEAHGEGPHTFSAMAVQEFQWSRSLVVLLLKTLPLHFRRLPWRLRLRFLFALSCYPLLALAATAGVSLVVVAAVSGVPWVSVNYWEFLLRWFGISVWLLTLTTLLRHWGLLRPRLVPVLSWENWLYNLARWPYIAWGAYDAVVQRIRPRPVLFKVTPKLRGNHEPLPARLTAPYCVLSIVTSLAAIIGAPTLTGFGYVFLCLVASVSYAILAFAVPLLHAKESAKAAGCTLNAAVRATATGPLMLAALTCGLVIVALTIFTGYVQEVL